MYINYKLNVILTLEMNNIKKERLRVEKKV